MKSYLTFKLNNELFAINVKNVYNIIEMQKFTKVPYMPKYVKGVINLRGDALPVIDIKQKLSLSEKKLERPNILVLDLNNIHLGIIVDKVDEVLEIEDNEILPNPKLLTEEFIIGFYKNNEEFIMVLDMGEIFRTNEILNLKTKFQE